jgi:hypothetical protein
MLRGRNEAHMLKVFPPSDLEIRVYFLPSPTLHKDGKRLEKEKDPRKCRFTPRTRLFP